MIVTSSSIKTNYRGGSKGSSNSRGRGNNSRAYSLLILVIVQKEVWMYLRKEQWLPLLL